MPTCGPLTGLPPGGGVVGCPFLALVLLGSAWAADGDLDPNFNPGVGAHSVPILWGKLLLGWQQQDNGKRLLHGGGGVANRAIARLNNNGSTDTSFTSPVTTGWVNNCYLLNPTLATSQMLIAGPFTISHLTAITTAWPG